MRGRVAEHVLHSRPGGPMVKVRVDLHGVSVFGPGDARTLLRWEWITSLDALEDRVIVRSANAEIALPPGSFEMSPADLAARLEVGRSILDRAEVIGQLAGG